MYISIYTYILYVYYPQGSPWEATHLQVCVTLEKSIKTRALSKDSGFYL